MKKKTEDFCKHIKKLNKNTECDNLSQFVFDDSYENSYIQEYKFKESEKSNLKLVNFTYRNFENCGDNVKNLMEQILENKRNLVYFKGGIGCGKTRFLRFLLDDVVPKLEFTDQELVDEKPIFFYYDCLYNLETYKDEKISYISKKFIDDFFLQIEDKIVRDCFNEDSEIKDIWKEIIDHESKLKSTSKKNHVFIKIKKHLKRTEESETAKNRTVQEKIENRQVFLDSLIKEDNNKILYYAALLKYIVLNKYKGNNHGILVVLDNIDQEEPPVQEKIIDVARTLSDKADIRVICVVRHSTYSYQVRNASVKTKETVNYIGPEPHIILINNLDSFLKGQQTQDKLYHYDVQNLKALKAGVSKLRRTVLNHEIFIRFFNGICGHNMRRAFLLSRNLLCNSVYNPYIIGRQLINQMDYYEPIRNTMRAILLGMHSKYSWDDDHLIENLFEVHDSRFESYLIKTRILKIVQNKKFSICKEMLYVLKAFEYNHDLIETALIEMMNEPKRLLWNDNVIQFKPNEIKRHPNSRFFLTATGQGYLSVLFTEINYIEEMLLDTETEEQEIEKDFYSKDDELVVKYDIFDFFDKIELVTKFCKVLLKEDLEETGRFLKKNSPETYQKVFHSKSLITYELLIGVRNSLVNILESRKRNSLNKKNQKLLDYSEKTLSEFESNINIASDGLKSAIMIKEGRLKL